ncbi:MAG: MBL fold metallo-hydrolase, partial [Pseudomonadales bacterium]|nr:MBL fold metallo-hydrolase [Pseudomonadales bacterium]
MQVAEQLIVEQIQIGPMQNFAYLVGDRTTREVVVVDPAWDIPGLLGMIEERDYTLTGALLTHYHPDHCGGSFGHNTVEGVSRLLEHHSVPIYANEHEAAGVKKVTGISDTDIKKVT